MAAERMKQRGSRRQGQGRGSQQLASRALRCCQKSQSSVTSGCEIVASGCKIAARAASLARREVAPCDT